MTVSLVYYDTELEVFSATLESLRASIAHLAKSEIACSVTTIVVDNGSAGVELTRLMTRLFGSGMHDWEIIEPGGNIGFGSGHNLAIFNFQSDYHLVLNPDVLVAEDALRHALLFMEDNQDIGMLTPDIRGLNGIKQNLCKYYPSVTHLFIRGFLSNSLRSWVERYLQPYEVHLRDQVTVLSNSMMASGCFMFIRHSLIDTIRGFSPDFFIYFEDFDLSRRINKVSHIAYVPQVRIVHRGGYASRKGVGHVLMFARSASMFFNKYGWRWF